MSVRAMKAWVFLQSCTGIGFNPEYGGISAGKIRAYIKEHSMPKDPEVTKQDLIQDISNSSGLYTLSADAKEETADYVADMLNELWF